ncbi:hypothetical protein RGQ29_020740 [Quercus rubra]|uniref:CC-NBS-LRR protein n=1 Tax=Quercus rubra TaxID=3512 RepID=A0AAN7FG62_QUERU|nr:hypothetical protein RGQ29_020740 [Quercus rubra]
MVLEIFGEAFLSALLGPLFDRLTSPLIKKFFGDSDNQSLLEKLRSYLLTVNAVLIDAEEKQITNPRVKEWVNQLKDVAYQADDLLDEIDTIALSRKLKDEAKVKGKVKVKQKVKVMAKQVLDLFPNSNSNEEKEVSVKLDTKMESRLKKIVERLGYLAKERDLLDLKESVRPKPPPMLPTTSLVDENSKVFGRDKVKEELKIFLLSDNAQDNEIPVIAVTGIGGVGKTTLAQFLYNDLEVVRNFKLRAWVYVSEEFDVFKTTRTIYESFTLRNCNVRDLNVLQIRLREKLKKKRFLLVLDGIWNMNFSDWDLLSKPLIVGDCKSKIIVTTCNQSVASIMRAVVTYRLPHLSDEDCWSLFVKHAYRTSNPEEPLRTIGMKIVKKCNGLPLAVKTLGSLLRSKVEVEEWQCIMNSKIWDLPNDKSSILPSLRLSYYHLPSHLKQCFSYCAMFPKDYEFEKEKLVLLWMAEGFLQQPKGKETMEEIGGVYFNELLSRSFFQPSSYNNWCFVMHELVNDLAQLVSGEFCCKFEDGNSRAIPEKARHFACLAERLDGPEKFVGLSELKSLRTFLPLSTSNFSQCCDLSTTVIDGWLPSMKRLRVLTFSCYKITKLPDSLGQLIHLRYLDLSQTLITKLPSSTCSLHNLQTLLLSRCRNFTVLPVNMGDLLNLRHLDVSETNLIELPPEFGRLKNLRVLTDFVLNGDSGSKISELGKLSHLRSSLSISKLEYVGDAAEALEANLQNKNYLKKLVFKWTDDAHGVHKQTVVLENLQPHKNLEKLTIEKYGGSKFPNWLGDASFSNMVLVRLSQCRNCTSLPPLGQLSSLQELYIEKMGGLRVLDSEFCGNNHFPFGSLKTLSFEEMPRWERWMHEGKFPSLRVLRIRQCIELIERLPEQAFLPCLQTLELSNCTNISQFPEGSLPLHLTSLVITNCNNLTPQKEWGLQGMVALTRFEIEGGCSNVTSFPEEGLLPNTLTFLRISRLPNLKFLVNGLRDVTSLETLDINCCEKLESMQELPNTLTSLLIKKCLLLGPRCEEGGEDWPKISHIASISISHN